MDIGFSIIFVQDNGRPCLGNWNETKPNAEPNEVDCVLEETLVHCVFFFWLMAWSNKGGVIDIWGFPEMEVPQ